MKTDNIVESLQKYGIRAAAYRTPPIGKEVFALTIHSGHKEGVVLVNQGSAEVDVCGSKKLRQAAFTVWESGRKITRRVMAFVIQKSRPTRERKIAELKRQFPVIMPATSEWTVAGLSCSRETRRDGHGKPFSTPGWRLRATITAEVKDPTINHFLVGMDETRNFICPISRHVTTVLGAHRILRADGARKKTLRQGEWFFIPCTCKMNAVLNHIASTRQGRIRPRVLGDTTHIAKSSIRTRGAIYARGYVTDRRTGHHKATFLPTWHKVVKNKEATLKVSSFQREAMRRRQRTWD